MGDTVDQRNALKQLVDVVVLFDEHDRVRWKIGNSRKFKVGDLYLQLRYSWIFVQVPKFPSEYQDLSAVNSEK